MGSLEMRQVLQGGGFTHKGNAPVSTHNLVPKAQEAKDAPKKEQAKAAPEKESEALELGAPPGGKPGNPVVRKATRRKVTKGKEE